MRKKLIKILKVDSLPNVFSLEQRSSWLDLQEFFGNSNPLTLEIGCGRGDYAIGFAQRFPDRNFLGVDVKGARLWTGARNAEQLGLRNVAFLRAPAEMLTEILRQGEVAEIWVTFPDPFVKKRTAKRRVTGPAFLATYRKLLRPGGLVHLKTDDPGVFEFTKESLAEEQVEILACVQDLYSGALDGPAVEIQTKYEQQHLAAGKTIRYLSFSFKSA